MFFFVFDFRSRSGYDSSSGGESENEYGVSICRVGNNQSQNSAATNASNSQGKHINKGRWTKEEVRETRTNRVVRGKCYKYPKNY